MQGDLARPILLCVWNTRGKSDINGPGLLMSAV